MVVDLKHEVRDDESGPFLVQCVEEHSDDDRSDDEACDAAAQQGPSRLVLHEHRNRLDHVHHQTNRFQDSDHHGSRLKSHHSKATSPALHWDAETEQKTNAANRPSSEGSFQYWRGMDGWKEEDSWEAIPYWQLNLTIKSNEFKT